MGSGTLKMRKWRSFEVISSAGWILASNTFINIFLGYDIKNQTNYSFARCFQETDLTPGSWRGYSLFLLGIGSSFSTQWTSYSFSVKSTEHNWLSKDVPIYSICGPGNILFLNSWKKHWLQSHRWISGFWCQCIQTWAVLGQQGGK